MKSKLLLSLLVGAAIAAGNDVSDISPENNGEATGSVWVPPNRIHGWGADKHSPALRVNDSDREQPARDRIEWTQWKATFGADRSYSNSSDEELHARIFEETEMLVAESIIAYEKGTSSYYLGINEFADMTEEEVAKYRMSPETAKARQDFNERMNVTRNAPGPAQAQAKPPAYLDWRNYIQLTNIKNQLNCGSCYAFSSISAVEAQIAIKYGVTVDLSEQFILDCSWMVSGSLNAGCIGGLETVVYEWLVESNRSILTTAQYPYMQSRQSCTGMTNGDLYKVKSYYAYPPDEDRLKVAVAAYGPITCGISGYSQVFHNYQGGIFDDINCGTEIDHAVVAIGYGTQNGKDYWIIRNSWGTNWGEGGYMRLSRGNRRCGFPDTYAWPVMY